jgi:hypothetical protein
MVHGHTSGVSRDPCKPDFCCGLFHYLNWTLLLKADFFPITWQGVLILTADCSVYLIWTHWFWQRIVCLPNMDTLILTTVFTFNMGCTAGMLTPTWHLIPPLIYSEVSVRPFSDLYFLYDLWDWLMFVDFWFHISNYKMAKLTMCKTLKRTHNPNRQ